MHKHISSFDIFSIINLHRCSKETKEAAYRSPVRPIVEYASPVWDPHTKADTDKFLFLFIYNPESHYGIVGSGFPLLFSIRQWRVFNVPGTGPVYGASRFTSLAKDIIHLGEESVMTQPVNQ